MVDDVTSTEVPGIDGDAQDISEPRTAAGPTELPELLSDTAGQIQLEEPESSLLLPMAPAIKQAPNIFNAAGGIVSIDTLDNSDQSILAPAPRRSLETNRNCKHFS
jgi:hypothetical protein